MGLRIGNTYKYLLLSLVVIWCTGCKDERGLVVGKIQEASDLTTTEVTVDKVVFGKEYGKIGPFKLGEAEFVAYSKAKIKTGIDLSRITSGDVIIKENKIELRLPGIKVINFSYPPSEFVEDTVISDPKAFLAKIDVEEQERFFREAEADIRSNLQYYGIVETTQAHTRTMLTRLLRSLGYEEIFITFKDDKLQIDSVDLSKIPTKEKKEKPK